MTNILLVDGYVDEPTCLGVPPYISPYPRYIFGAIMDVDDTNVVVYKTIDQIRGSGFDPKLFGLYDILILIAGAIVPGRYLSGYPVSFREASLIASLMKNKLRILCGPTAKYGFGVGGGASPKYGSNFSEDFDVVISGDAEMVINNIMKNLGSWGSVDPSFCRLDPSDILDFSIKGASVVSQHPFFPDYVITEIETYRGCSRSISGGCSFCSEPQKGVPKFRKIYDIVQEIGALYQQGIRHIRLGNQPCFFSYQAINSGTDEFPRPNVTAIKQLLSSITSVAPDLKTLHIDNANPGVIAHFPDESKDIAEIIIQYHTAGDVAAFGVESIDEEVIKQNNLKASAEDVLSAIRILNDVGAKRGNNGLPELLPGLNFIFGLLGETKSTYRQTIAFLNRICNEGLMVRRINLRQVLPLQGTKMFETGSKIIAKHHQYFTHLKNKVKKEIESPLLKKMLPFGIKVSDVFTEIHHGNLTFGRQLGSYPILIGIPGIIPLNRYITVKVVDHGYRSITAIPYPLDINKADMRTLEALPGIGKKRAYKIVQSRPVNSWKQLYGVIDEPSVVEKIRVFFE